MQFSLDEDDFPLYNRNAALNKAEGEPRYEQAFHRAEAVLPLRFSKHPRHDWRLRLHPRRHLLYRTGAGGGRHRRPEPRPACLFADFCLGRDAGDRRGDPLRLGEARRKTRRRLSCGSPRMGGNFVRAVHPAGHFQRGGHRAAAWRRTGHRDGRRAVYTHFPALHAFLHVQLHPALLRPQRRRSVACHDRDDGIQPVQHRHGLGADVPTGDGHGGRGARNSGIPHRRHGD